MLYSLYIDDERTPKTSREFCIVRSCDEAINFVLEHGMPMYVSFDHDLGTGASGYDFAKWLVEYMIDHNITTMFEFNVHSANPVGSANINSYLENYRRYLGN